MKIKEDWVQISEKTDSKSPLDCLILFLRNSLGDISRNMRLENHAFNDINPTYELLDFVEQDDEEDQNSALFGEPQEQVPTIHYNDNWDEIEEDILREEEEVRNDLSMI